MELRQIAKKIVRTVAPEENGIFDLVWNEYQDDPAAELTGADAYDHGLGMGGNQQVTSWSVIVIKLVVAMSRDRQARGDIEARAKVWIAGETGRGAIVVDASASGRLAELPRRVAEALGG
jgi:hypothetical protein